TKGGETFVNFVSVARLECSHDLLVRLADKVGANVAHQIVLQDESNLHKGVHLRHVVVHDARGQKQPLGKDQQVGEHIGGVLEEREEDLVQHASVLEILHRIVESIADHNSRAKLQKQLVRLLHPAVVIEEEVIEQQKHSVDSVAIDLRNQVLALFVEDKVGHVSQFRSE